MKTRTIFIMMILLSGSFFDTFAQDTYFSQFQNEPLYYNPAYTGLYTGARVRLAFRDQWPTLPYDFKAYHFSGDIGARSLPGSGGIGITMTSDNEGLAFIKNFNLGLNLSVRIPISQNAIGQLGIKAAWLQKRVNWDDFVFSDELSEKYGKYFPSGFIPPDRNVVNMADFGVGGIVQFANEGGSLTGNVGFAVDHLFEPDQSFIQTAKAEIPRKYIGHLDLVYAIGSSSGYGMTEDDALKLNPGIIYQSQGGLNVLQLGTNITKFGVYMGLWYKGGFGNYNNSALVMLAGYRYIFSGNIGVKFTYSYDLELSGDLMGTGGAHEITLVVDFNSGGFLGGTSGNSVGRPMVRRGGYDSRLECSEF